MCRRSGGERVGWLKRIGLATGTLVALVPTPYAFATGGEVPPGLSMGAGVLALLAAALLLREMLALRAVARGAAIVDNLSYVILAATCLAASVLAGWVARFVGVSADHARLGADLLAVVGIVLFVIYFSRVRRAMKRYLNYLVGEEQLLVSVLDAEDEEGTRG